MKTKVCKDCGQEKSLDNFYKSGKYYKSYCKICSTKKANKWNKEHRKEISKKQKFSRLDNKLQWKERDRKSLLKKRGLILEDYDKMVDEQHGVCAICGKPEIRKNQYGIKPLGIDHNHNTNKTRGLLCDRCNTAIGLLGVDSFGILNLEAAIKYIKKYEISNKQVA